MSKRCRPSYFITRTEHRLRIDRLIDHLSAEYGDLKALTKLQQHPTFTQHVDLDRRLVLDNPFEVEIRVAYNRHNHDVDRDLTPEQYAERIQQVSKQRGADHVDISLHHIYAIDVNLQERTLSLFVENITFSFIFRVPSDVVGYLLMLESIEDNILGEEPTWKGENALFWFEYDSDAPPQLPTIRYKQQRKSLPNGRQEERIRDHHQWTNVSLFPPFIDSDSSSIRESMPSKTTQRIKPAYFIQYPCYRRPIDRLIDELSVKPGGTRALAEVLQHELFAEHINLNRTLAMHKPFATEIHVDFNRHNPNIDRTVPLEAYTRCLQNVHRGRLSKQVDISLTDINSLDVNLQARSISIFTESLVFLLTFRVPSDVVGYFSLLLSTGDDVLCEAPTRKGDTATFWLRYFSDDMPLVIRYKQREGRSPDGHLQKLTSDPHQWRSVSLFGPMSASNRT